MLSKCLPAHLALLVGDHELESLPAPDPEHNSHIQPGTPNGMNVKASDVGQGQQ